MKGSHKIKDWFKRHKPSKRRLIQVYAALLYNANIKGFVTGDIYKGNSKYACVPGLNCYSCPGAVGACPLGALQNALASSGTKAPYYVFGIIILFGLLLGRTICGFLCPMGLIQDLLYKIKSPKLKKNRVTRILSYLKYVILAVMVIIIPLAYAGIFNTIPAFCKYICPSGTLLGSISLLANSNNGEDYFSMLGPLFTWKFCVLVLIIVGSIFIYRLFCRFLCPLGALYSLFCRVAMIGVKLDKQKCIDCGLCVQTCKMDIRHVGDHECIHCGDCLKVCPTKAISWKGSKIFLHPNAIEEGGESASGEKVGLHSLLSSSTSSGGTLAINAGGAPTSEGMAVTAAYPDGNGKNDSDIVDVISKETAPVAKARAVAAEQTVAEDELPAEEAGAAETEAVKAKRLRIYYIYSKENGWRLSPAEGTNTFSGRGNAVKYAIRSAGSRSALIYVQSEDGSFALTIRKQAGGQAEEIAAVTEAPVTETAAAAAVPVTAGAAEVKAETAEATSAYVPVNAALVAADSGAVATPAVAEAPLSKAEIKARKKAYHATATYQKKRNRALEICAWAAALLVLATALIYYNFIYQEVEAEVIYNIGDTVSSFTMKKYFGDEDDTYTLADDLEENRVVVLNFWYIGCQPCQEELPEFGELAEAYPDDVSVVVIHSSVTATESVKALEAYVKNSMGWEFWQYDNVSFTLDNSGEDSLYTAMQGTDAYPMTVILDSNGKISYRHTSKIDRTTLFKEVETLISQK